METDPFPDALRRGLNALMSLVAAGASGAGVMFLFSFIAGPIGMAVGLLAAPFWLIAALVVGAPLWALLHASGHRSRLVARLSGAVAAGLCAPPILWLFIGYPASTGDPRALGGLLLIGVAAPIAGAVAGNVAWSLGYGDPHA